MHRPLHDQQQNLQDDEYEFPYHFVPRLQAGHYTPFYLAPWGHIYLAYLEHALARLAVRDWNSLIDVGCGDGCLVAMLHERFPKRTITGVDPSERAIAVARGLVPHAHFHVGDITKLGLFDRTFDAATCIETLQRIDPAELPEFVAALRRLLEHDGTLLVTVPSVKLPLAAKHCQHFTRATLEAALAEHFRAERIEHLNREGFLFKLAGKLLFNRYFIVSDKRVLHSFYRHYRRFHTVTDERHGERILGIFRAI
jgi:ubiquinone/menaquinone biosynthesis C-methylase UbiE